MASRRDPWADAVAHLMAVDSRWRPIIDRIGPCALRPNRDRFGMLVRAIIAQQISSKAAQSIERRVRALSGDVHRAERLLEAGESGLRAAGVSPQKVRYLLSLAELSQAGALPLERVGRWDDERIIACLCEVKGIGRWTAEMFLVFALNRPDVMSVGDLGIRTGIGRFFGLPEPPRPGECLPLTEDWRPYRSVAMWYLWRFVELSRKGPAPPETSPVESIGPNAG